MKVGFIGLGNIGGACAVHLAESEHDFFVHDLNRAAAEPLLEKGATWSDSCAAIAATVDVLILSLPGPDEVRAVVTGDRGVLTDPAEGLVVVDLSTISLDVTREMYTACAGRGAAYVDCPVSGGIWGAQAGELVLMPAGDEAAVNRAMPALTTFGKDDTRYLGESGTGTLVKLVNNQLFLVGGQIFQEGYLLAMKAGLDAKQFVRMLRESSGGMYAPLASMVTKRQWEDSTYDLALAEKDVRLAVATADRLGVDMPLARAAHETLAASCELGLERKFFLATMELLEQRAGFTAPEVDVDS